MKTFTLCADDYAQSPAISAGIRALMKQRRLSAVSCFTESPHWPAEAPLLLPHRDHLAVGLHLNLTHPFLPGTLPVGQWIRRAAFRQIDAPAILASFQRQYASFLEHVGAPPDFIDGHQHIHVFPIIRQACFDLLAPFPQATRPWLRSLFPLLSGQKTSSKTRILRLLSRGFHPADHHIRTNDEFGGFYNLKPATSLPDLFPPLLASISGHALLMCHPGAPSNDSSDPIAATRHLELDYFSSHSFQAELDRLRLHLRPFGPRFS